jgi:hypothetical protein
MGGKVAAHSAKVKSQSLRQACGIKPIWFCDALSFSIDGELS